MERLVDFEQQFRDIDATVAAIAAALAAQQTTPGRARDELAQLEARLDKLQCQGVDCIDTLELKSGKEQARALRKALTKRAEQMHVEMDELFAAIKEAAAATSASATSASATAMSASTSASAAAAAAPPPPPSAPK